MVFRSSTRECDYGSRRPRRADDPVDEADEIEDAANMSHNVGSSRHDNLHDLPNGRVVVMHSHVSVRRDVDLLEQI